ncbi:transcriptional regulator [Roseiarcus fermentans]|uniref:Transcriptional regulator n=1 Tax=Roseiarcus fermentans TaxID=1473586 RepID=A0A366FN95_9HYPH|nr:SpoIIE family protein phosphatase [Roseiarcus fermentans]RBP16098.1 transcriptional regulator [Roseiarcus fermentans]
MNVFETERPATLADGSWLRRAMARRLQDLRLPVEIVDDLQLVVSEIVANAVLHGSPAPRTLGVRVDIEGVDLVVAITDDGGPFCESERRIGSERASDPLAATGRGLALARAALDRNAYQGGVPNRFTGWRSLRRRRATALVVEDTPALLEAYTETLQRDYRVIASSSMEEAKSALREQTIDVVLADVHLGDGLGVALPDEIAALDGGALPVVLISSDTSTATRDSALRLGAEFYLSKPVRPQALRDAVALALSRATVRDARLARRFARHVDGFLTGRLPERMNGYRAASAGGTAEAGGGDLVLHLPMGDGDRIVLVDVMGHGVAARAWAVAYAAIVRTLHHCLGAIDAGAFLTELARVAWTDPTLERALATVLVVDLDAHGALVASAGHPPPLVVGAAVRRTTVVNVLLGVLPPEPHEAERIDLEPGDRLALFTDGLDPADVAAGGDPPPWFMSALLGGRADPLALVGETLRQATETALGPRPADDWTFVIVEKGETP